MISLAGLFTLGIRHVARHLVTLPLSQLIHRLLPQQHLFDRLEEPIPTGRDPVQYGELVEVERFQNLVHELGGEVLERIHVERLIKVSVIVEELSLLL